MIVWWNGKLCASEDVRISPFDHGFLVGDGVFETLVARDGTPVAARRHWNRLLQSCRAMDIRCVGENEYWDGLNEVLKANSLTSARLRVTLTSGTGPLGSGRGDDPPNCVIVATKLQPWPETEKVVTSPWPVLETGALAGVKSTSYAANVRSLAYAKSRNCGEAILLNSQGHLCEGTGSNLFVVIDGQVMTPPLTAGCLAGTVRAMVIEACASANVEVHEVDLPASVLGRCEEAFLTSSTRDVHPVSEENGRALGEEAGPVTRKIQRLYVDHLAREPLWQ